MVTIAAFEDLLHEKPWRQQPSMLAPSWFVPPAYHTDGEGAATLPVGCSGHRLIRSRPMARSRAGR